MSIHATNSDMVPRGGVSNVPDDDDDDVLGIAVAGVVDDTDSVVVFLLWLDFIILRSIPPPGDGGLGDDEIACKGRLAKYIVVHENAKATNSKAVNSLSVREEDDPNFFRVVPMMTQ